MKNILVFLEYEKGQLKSTSAEAATAAAEIAGKAGTEAYGVAIGEADDTPGKYGLKKVFAVKHELLNDYSSQAVAKALAQVAEKNDAGTVFFSANAKGLELAPRVAVRLEAGYIADTISLEYSDGIKVKKPIYAGKTIAEMKVETENQVFSIRPNIVDAAETGSAVAPEEFVPELTDADVKVKVKSVNKNEGKLDVAEADVIVSGGRGLKESGNFGIVEELASKLGAAVGASRAVVDAEWRPHAEQVGQTGKTVSPSLYVACGISGAIQHLAGMSGSKKIAAINKDKDAPIFNVVDYGIVGDAMDVIPKIVSKL